MERLNRVEGRAFVVQLGDFTELGMLREYELMRDVHARLRVPWFLVIGNHDLLSNGGAVYDRMFGPRSLALTVGGALATPLQLLDRRVAVFAEAAALDHLLRLWYLNPRTLGAADAFSLALGARVAL